MQSAFAEDIEAFALYRGQCYAKLRSRAARFDSRGELDVDAWIATGWRHGLSADDLVLVYMTQEARILRHPAPAWRYETKSGVWLALYAHDPSLKKQLATVKRLFAITTRYAHDSRGVYVGFREDTPDIIKIGSTRNLTQRQVQLGPRFKCLLWLSFGGMPLEAQCHQALREQRAEGVGREWFAVSQAVAITTVLSAAASYLRSMTKAEQEVAALTADARSHTGVVSTKEAVLMLRAEIEQLRAKGYGWGDIASLLKDDGHGDGIVITGSTLAAIHTTSLHRHSVPFPRVS